jgi:hypothetical protein
MKARLFSLLTCFFAFQAYTQNYFQQEVNYKINVTLNDQTHAINGNIEIEYVNHAPQALDSIWFHLWGNAFKNASTAFARQQLRYGNTKFYFARESDLGYYTGLDFSLNGEKTTWYFDKKNPDIALVKLLKPLKTNEKIVISTPFTLKIPASFSRLGHVGTSYQMTQWYPKPAVLDAKGWHPMPYLDMGEFYSEFGDFDVTITLPENYVVGATGILQTESERLFLAKKVTETEALKKNGFSGDNSFPPSSLAMKTLHYTAEKIHDFAWFADKRFHVLKEEAVLPSGRKVDAWAMFTNEEADLWVKGADYVKRAVEFYSDKLGEYPWPHATAVMSALSAGGGMEYPMITVIGKSNSAKALDDVITHEVGHNWLYGILASNERDHAWMDEGINSYYEYRYMRQYYGRRMEEMLPKFLEKASDMDFYELGYLFQARRNLDQAPETTSDDFSPVNYVLGAYVKPGTAFDHLEKYLGTERFDEIMHTYFEKWKFRHPYPEDLRAIIEKNSSKNLDWFFDEYLFSNKKLDYSLQDVSGAADSWQLTVQNQGDIAAPFPVSGLKNGQVMETKWFEGVDDEAVIEFPQGDYDMFVLDAEHVTMDVFRKNNSIKTSGAFKRLEPFRLRLLGPLENSQHTTLNITPAAGWNAYDNFMLGLSLHNGLLPTRKMEFQLAPMYAFGSKKLAGMGNLQYNIFPVAEKIRKISFGLSARNFAFNENDSLRTETGYESTTLRYRRLMPYARLELVKSPTSKFYQAIQIRAIFLGEQDEVFRQDSTGSFYNGNEWFNSNIQELSWELGDKRTINPYSFRLAFEHQQYNDPFGREQKYLKASFELKSEYTYEQNRSVNLRVFMGKFFQNAARKNRGLVFREGFNLSAQGFNDYRYDDIYFDRTGTDGLLSHQVSPWREGGMKIPLGSAFSEGRSNDFIFAINLEADLPQDLPLNLPMKPYFDIGYYNDTRPISSDLTFNDQVWWQGGVMLEFGRGIANVYFPVVHSKNLGGEAGLLDSSGKNNFGKRISFSINLNALNPWRLAEYADQIQF